MKQTVYIYKCVNSTIKVTGKGSFHIFLLRVADQHSPLDQGSTDQNRSVPGGVWSSNFETSKVNSITMDACKKCAIVFENSVAALEVIGSQSIQAQVTGKVPIVNGMFSNRIFKRNPCIYTVIQLIKPTVFNCTYLWNHWKLILLLLKFLR